MSKLQIRFALVILINGWAWLPTIGQELKARVDNQVVTPEAAKSVLVQMWETAEKRRSGHCRFAAKMFAKPGELTHAFNGQIAFDLDRKLERFDYLFELDNQIAADPTPGELPLVKFVRTPDWCLSYSPRGADSVIGRFKSDHELGGWLGPLDLRFVGLLTWSFWNRAKEKEITQLRESLFNRETTSAIRSDDLLVLTWERKGGALGTRKRLWIDESRSCLPVREEIEIQDNATGMFVLDQSILVSWAEHKSNWVPLRAQFINPPDFTCDMNFEWLACNELLDKELFATQGLKAPPGTKIVDFRGPKPVVEGIVEPMPEESQR